jgi:chemosensory pili system protein ChpA (sensor histidine kinase/response regulator)
VLRLGGRVVPLAHLAEALGLKDAGDTRVLRLKIVVIQVGDQQLAVMVDQILEAREVVVKNVGVMLGRVRGVIGATILGDGAVVLIVNPNDLILQQQALQTATARRRPAIEAQAHKPLDILVVDDSPSVRRVLATLIKGAGWNPRVAKDGLDALELLQAANARPDVVLLDIEMPRMDGYELAANLRSQAVYRNVPIVMLTSRARDKHRKRAFEVGANDYVVKPYQDEHLLGVIRKVVNDARGVLTQ